MVDIRENPIHPPSYVILNLRREVALLPNGSSARVGPHHVLFHRPRNSYQYLTSAMNDGPPPVLTSLFSFSADGREITQHAWRRRA